MGASPGEDQAHGAPQQPQLLRPSPGGAERHLWDRVPAAAPRALASGPGAVPLLRDGVRERHAHPDLCQRAGPRRLRPELLPPRLLGQVPPQARGVRHGHPLHHRRQAVLHQVPLLHHRQDLHRLLGRPAVAQARADGGPLHPRRTGLPQRRAEAQGGPPEGEVPEREGRQGQRRTRREGQEEEGGGGPGRGAARGEQREGEEGKGEGEEEPEPTQC